MFYRYFLLGGYLHIENRPRRSFIFHITSPKSRASYYNRRQFENLKGNKHYNFITVITRGCEGGGWGGVGVGGGKNSRRISSGKFVFLAGLCILVYIYIYFKFRISHLGINTPDNAQI